MSGYSTNPITQVGDGETGATLQKHGDHNALEVDSDALLKAINENTEVLKAIFELLSSNV